MIDIKKYDLPDFSIFDSVKNSFFIWNPDRKIVVLGTSNTPGNSVIIENVMDEEVDVYVRPSGGQAVVLTPKTLVISVLFNIQELISPKEIFIIVNQAIIKVLTDFGVKGLAPKGISDIAIGEKKILGSSIYRKKEKFFYHAVLNISEKTSTIEKYLKHPVKEPDYRKGRSHADFVTSLKNEGYDFEPTDIKNALKNTLAEIVG
jgi:lipoate---protein ligase